MSVFIDTSGWYAAADRGDKSHRRAVAALSTAEPRVTTDHVLAETWILLRHRLGREPAECFWAGLRQGVASIEPVTIADLETAWAIGESFRDQDFSLIDRTSFAVMVRLGIRRVVSFDDDFSVFRYGPDRRLAFDVVRR